MKNADTIVPRLTTQMDVRQHLEHRRVRGPGERQAAVRGCPGQATQSGRQQPGQGRQDRAVGPIRPGTGHLAAEHHHLMTEHHDLRVLGRLAPAQQDQPAEHPDHEQVQQTDRHEPRSCLNPPNPPNRRSRAMYRVLKRYRVKLVKVNVDDSPKLQQCFNVMAIPTLMVLRRGQVAAQRAVRCRPRACAPGWRRSSGTSRTRDAPAPRRREAVISGRSSDQVTG
jgi:hypothetical protein